MKESFSRIETVIENGLAIRFYLGSKIETIFLMPYPHASSSLPIIQSELGEIFIDLGYNIISFDPPGLFQSTRKEKVSMEEMVNCTIESINMVAKNNKKLILAGHSMSGFCCFPIIHQYPEKFTKLILIGTLAGFKDIKKYKGLPFKFGYTKGKFWQVVYYGIRLMYYRGNMEIQKKLDNIYKYESWVDKSKVKFLLIEKEDKKKKSLKRASWPRIAKKLNFHSYLNNINQETTIIVGRFDPQTPLGCSEKIHSLIPHSKIVIFEKSGHFPFVEEKEEFQKHIENFIRSNNQANLIKILT